MNRIETSWRIRRGREIAVTAALTVMVFASSIEAIADGIDRNVPTNPGSALGEAKIERQGDTLKLSLDDTISIALSRNLGLHVQRFVRARSFLGVRQAKGIFDLNLGAILSASDTQNPSSSNLSGAAVQKQKQEEFDLNLSQLVPTGGTAGVGFTNGRFETNSTFFSLNPSYSTGLNLSFTQPLLQNFGRDVTNYGIEVARAASGVSHEAFVQQVTAVAQNAVAAYWNLVNAREQSRVAREALALARQLHEQNQVRVRVGTLAPLELVSSEAGIAIREQDIITAESAIGDAEDVLRALLNLDQGEAWEMHIEPTTQPSDEPITVSVDDAIRTALDSRPELAGKRIANQSLELDARFAHQAVKPRLDLKATYGWNGVGGTAILRDAQGNVIGTEPGGYSDSLKQVTGFDFPGWTFGLNFGIPLQNRSAKAKSAIADLALDQGKIELEQLQQNVAVEVRTAARTLRTARQVIDSATVSSRLAEKNLDAEQKKYQNGLSTSFNVLQVQQQLTAARQSEVTARTVYNKAIADYFKAIGKLLDRLSVHVTE